MSSLTRPKAVLFALLLPLGAHAEMLNCPTSHDGQPLARMDGVSIYIGDPRNGMDLAPDQQARDMRGRNVWRPIGRMPLTLVCRYQGASSVVVKLPPTLRECVQDLAAPSLACR